MRLQLEHGDQEKRIQTGINTKCYSTVRERRSLFRQGTLEEIGLGGLAKIKPEELLNARSNAGDELAHNELRLSSYSQVKTVRQA